MMRLRTGILLLIVLVLVAAGQAHSEPENDIIVLNADAREDTEITFSQDLMDLLGTIGSRLFVQWANTIRHQLIDPPPAELQSLFDTVDSRLFVQWANTMRHQDIDPPPAELETLFDGVSPRLFFQWANTARRETLAYPVDLIDDATPPIISDVANNTSGANVIITWTTDEFADSEVIYGTAPGNYPNSVGDPLYVFNHQITLTNLQPGTTYYYRAQSSDRSGNMVQSGEQSFTYNPETYTYIPIIQRHP